MTEWLGVDVGWVFPAADSDGRIYEWTKRTRPMDALALAGPVKIVRPNGETRVEPAYTPSEAAVAMARGYGPAIRGLANMVVTAAKDSERGVALEDWSSFERRKKAWTRVYGAIADQARLRNIPVMQVNRAYTSITCPRCDHKGRENRPSRDRFECVSCGFSGHADVVAAMNIARRAAGTFKTGKATCSNPVCQDPSWKAGVCAFCYHFRWKRGRLPVQADFQERAEAPDLGRYREQARRTALKERRERRDAETNARKAESYRTHDAWGNPLAGA